MILLQDDRRALLFGQLRHGQLDLPRQGLPRHQIFDRLGRLGGHRQVQQIHALWRLHDRCPALLPHPVAAEVDGDPIEPRGELGLPAEAGERTERPQERFLAHVSRILFAPDRAVRKGKDGPFPSQDELVEAVGVAADRSRDELLVRRRHAGVAYVV